jgi:hypothetical protein
VIQLFAMKIDIFDVNRYQNFKGINIRKAETVKSKLTQNTVLIDNRIMLMIPLTFPGRKLSMRTSL